MQSLYDKSEYRCSRNAYRWFCMLEYFIALMVSDVYLFKLLAYMGMSDSTIGIISSLITVACLFQLAAIGFAGRIRNVKNWVIIFCLIGQMVFVLMYLLPFLPFQLPVKTVMAYTSILTGYFFSYSVSSILFKWANSFVDPGHRAVYSAEKEMLSLLGGMIFTFILGMVMDNFEAAGHLEGAFWVMMAVGILVNVVSLIVLTRIESRDEEKEAPAHSPSFSRVIRGLMHNRGFIRVVVLSVIWSCAQYFTIGFLGSYKSKELMLSIGTVQIINIVGNVCRFFLSKPLGRYADRTSYAKCIEMALYTAAAGFLAAAFAVPELSFTMAVFTVLMAVSQAGIAQNLNNIVYDHVPPEYFVQAFSIRSCISGICGFGASLLGSGILNFVQKGNGLFGIMVYGQQVLAMGSFGLALFAAFYVRFRLGKR